MCKHAASSIAHDLSILRINHLLSSGAISVDIESVWCEYRNSYDNFYSLAEESTKEVIDEEKVLFVDEF